MCDDVSDEVVERRVLKGLLTAVTSTTIFVHGQALLLVRWDCMVLFIVAHIRQTHHQSMSLSQNNHLTTHDKSTTSSPKSHPSSDPLHTPSTPPQHSLHTQAVRACYNIYLMSRDETNRMTAKAALTQMINAVFQRMEAGDFVLVKPMMVTDVLGMPSAEINTMSAAVDAFMKEVMASVDLTGLYVSDLVDSIQQSLDSVFGVGGAEVCWWWCDQVQSNECVLFTCGVYVCCCCVDHHCPAYCIPYTVYHVRTLDDHSPTTTPQETPRATPPAATPPPAEDTLIPDAAPASQPVVPHKPTDAASSIAATDGGEIAPSTIGETPTVSPPPEPATEGEPLSLEEGPVGVVGDVVGEGKTGAGQRPTESGAAQDDRPHTPPPAVAAAALALQVPPRTAAQMERIQSLLQKDAFLVFRALCKLSIKTADATTSDQAVMRGKVLCCGKVLCARGYAMQCVWVSELYRCVLYIFWLVPPYSYCSITPDRTQPTQLLQELALELLKIVLENSGDVFRTSDRFTNAIKQYLCLSLLKNCTSSVPAVQRLSCSIFLTLLMRFRQSLKAEVGLFYPMILLRPIEPIIAGAQVSASGIECVGVSGGGSGVYTPIIHTPIIHIINTHTNTQNTHA